MAKKADLGVLLTVARGAGARVSLERAVLIETIDELGSISAAARVLGLSYRAAWDAVQALNNLFETPLIEAAPGGRAGGAALITPRGRLVAAGFRRVRAELDAALTKLDAGLAGGSAHDLFWSLGMRTSARNALRGQVSAILPGAVNTEVVLKLSENVRIVAILTRRSVEDLDLKVGTPAIALIQSSAVLLAVGDAIRTSARNHLDGVVSSREDGAVNSEILVDIGDGKTLTATVTMESARALDLKSGDPVTALVKAPHVILAVE